MTQATTEGRELVLTVEGGIDPFRVSPLPAKRGLKLTEAFVNAMLNLLTPAGGEAIFIECFGPANYSRMTGQYVDQFDGATGAYVQTWGPGGAGSRDDISLVSPLERADETGDAHVRYIPREALAGERELDGEPIRQEEAEALSLCAFYWQTVVGMEAVRAFLEEGEGTRGSLKALALLQSRMGLSQLRTSQPTGSAFPTQQGAIPGIATPPDGGHSVKLPAAKRSPLGLKLPNR